MGDRNRSRRVYSFYRAPPAPSTDGTTIVINGGGVTQSQLAGVWIDSGSIAGMKTTGSISIDSNFPTSGGRNANAIGTDVFFFVSGSNNVTTGPERHVAVLPDLVISGSVVKMNGTRTVITDTVASYTIFGSQVSTQLVGSNEVFINNAGNPAGYIILRPGGTIFQDAATVMMRDASFVQAALLTVTGSQGVRWSGVTQPPVGTDAFFFVSGTVGLTGTGRAATVFAGDAVMSGSLVVSGTLDTGAQIRLNSVAGGQYPLTSFGAVGAKQAQNIIGGRYNGTDYTLMSWDGFGDLIFGADTSFTNSPVANYMCATAVGSVYYLFGGLTTWQMWTNSGNNAALTVYRSGLDPLINQRSQDTDNPARTFIINAQTAYSTPSTTANGRGGNILLAAGLNTALGFLGTSSMGAVIVSNSTTTAVAGTDAMLFVSGSTGVASGVNRRVAVFGGDVVFSGSVTGLPSTFVSGTWRDAGNALVSTSSVSVDFSNRAATTAGTDVFFFVSGSNGVGSGPNRKLSVHGGDVYISGSLVIGTGSMPTVTGAIALSNGSIIVQRLTNGTNAYMMQVTTNNDIIYGGIGSGNNTNNYQASTHVFYNVTSNNLAVGLRQLQFADSSMIMGLANTTTAYAVSMQNNGNASSGSNGANMSISPGGANNNGSGGNLILVGGTPSGNGQGAGRVVIAPDNALNVATPTRVVFEGITSTLQDRNWVALCGNAGSIMVEGKMPQGTGNFVTYVGNASIIPNTSATDGALLYSVTGTLATRDATSELLLGKQICWGSGTIAPILTQASSTLGAGQRMTFAAQPGLSGSNAGGDLVLSGGAPGTFNTTTPGGRIILATTTASLSISTQACSASSTTPFGFFEALYTSGSTTTRVAIPMYPFLAKPGS